MVIRTPTVPLLAVQNVVPTQHVPAPPAQPVSFSLLAGTITILQGPSGCGKSRLLRALADLDPSSGSIAFMGREQSTVPAPLWRQSVVYVAAESGWWDDHVGSHFTPAAREQAQHLLSPIGLPRGALDWDVARASTGERQRLALLRALTMGDSTQPRVYLLDEPTAALDPETTLLVEALIRACVSDRPATACLMVSHLPAQAERLADQVLMLSVSTTQGASQ